MLKPFQDYKINLNRIESRPSNKGEYCFEMALDFNGDIRNTKVQVRMYTMRTQPALCQTEMLGMLCVRCGVVWCVCIKNFIEELKKHTANMLVLDQREVPWFPVHISEV